MPLVKSSDSLPELPAQTAAFDAARLSRDLESPDIDTRRLAVREAARMGYADLLADRLKVETNGGLRETILTSLVRIGGAGAARPLFELLRSEDPQLRNAVIETLQSMGDTIIPEIELLLEDPDSDVRIFAVNILQLLRCPQVPDIALKVIFEDPHVNVCAAAVDVLAEVGQPDMAASLRALLKRFPDQKFLAFAVRVALERIG